MLPNILKETVRGIQPIAIEDEFLKNREIFLTDEVNAQTGAELIKQLMYLERGDPGKEITLYITSPGGDVTSGLAVYDCIMTLRSPLRTVCIGTAASMGSILFLAGKKREMLPNTKIMIHDPSFAGGDYRGEKPAEIREKLNSLLDVRKTLCQIIADRTGKSIKQIYAKTKKDTYFSAKKALEYGIATDILKYRKG